MERRTQTESMTAEPVDSMRQGLAELCASLNIRSDAPEQGQDLDRLMGQVLEECERRLDEARTPELELRVEQDADGEGQKLRAMLALSRQAVALHRLQAATDETAASHACAGACGQRSEFFAALRELCHRINNPLTTLIGRSQLLSMTAKDDPSLLKAAKAIGESSERIANYVRELAGVVQAEQARSESE